MKDFVFQEILHEFEEVNSTNTLAKQMIFEGNVANCFILLAKKQMQGRGRLERKWISEDNGNLYFTICFEENLANDFKEIMPLYTAFCLLDAISLDAKYKWVNDVLIEGKKVAGILIEKVKGFFVIGIGVNLKKSPIETIFPAGNLMEFGVTINAKEMAEGIFNQFKNNLHLRREFVLNYLEQKFFTEGEITINQGEFKGKMQSLSKEGHLILKQNDGILKEIKFGDIGLNL